MMKLTLKKCPRTPPNDDIIDTNQYIAGQLIRIDETPIELNWKFYPLFRDDVHGGTLVWQIGFLVF